MRRPTATRCCWSLSRTPSTQRSTTSSISISSATSRRSRGICRVANVMAVHPSVPAKTIPEFIAYAKANPGEPTWRRPRPGSGRRHIAGELFNMMAGVDMVHVPYRGGGPALTDLLGGQVQVLFGSAPGRSSTSGPARCKALAVTSAARWKGLPDVPAMSEFLPGYEASAWSGSRRPETRPPRSSTS